MALVRRSVRSLPFGAVVFVDYGEAEEPWHERIILCEGTAEGFWFVLTPDDDVYEEELSVPPLRDLKVASSGARLPAGLGARHGQPVYRFRVRPTARRLAGYLAEARRMKGDEADDRAASEAGVVAVRPCTEDEEYVWLALSPSRLGERVEAAAVDAETVRGSAGVAPLPHGEAVPVMRVPVVDAAAFVEDLRRAAAALTPRGGRGRPVDDRPPGPSEDARTLPVERNSAGERFRTVQSAAETMSQEEFTDWALEGPRTTRWWLSQVARLGSGIVARHHSWKHENGVVDESLHNQVHEILCEAIELLVTVDQVDVSNLAGAEVMVRHVQYVEHEVKKKADLKRPVDNSEYFVGRSKRTGNALIAPDLLKWVSDQAAKDSAILKETRKAAEERALARAPKK